MKKVLTIGGATQDIYLDQQGADCMTIIQKQSKSKYMLFKSGEKIEVEDILYFTGGGATNSAASFKRQGFQVSCFCKIGDDQAGKFVLKDLENEEVDHSAITQTSKHQTGTSFIINSLRRERTIFAYRGANGFLKKEEIPFDLILKSDQIYITSLSHNSSKLLPEITEFAHKNNIPVAINPGSSQLDQGALTLRDCLKYIDIIIMNSEEAKTFMVALVETDKTYKEIFKSSKDLSEYQGEQNSEMNLLETPFLYKNYYFSIRKFFKEVLNMGPKIVVVTDGANGVYVAHNNEIFFHPSIKTDIKDTLGAGDAFGSCFVGSLLKEHDIEKSLKMGVINASNVISMMGAKPGLLNPKELNEKEKEIKKLTNKFKLNRNE